MGVQVHAELFFAGGDIAVDDEEVGVEFGALGCRLGGGAGGCGGFGELGGGGVENVVPERCHGIIDY